MDITIRKGDTIEIEVELSMNGELFVPQEEIVEFSVGFGKNKPFFICPVINGVAHITHEQTRNMECGNYKYDVRVYTKDKILVATPIFGVFKIVEVINNEI